MIIIINKGLIINVVGLNKCGANKAIGLTHFKDCYCLARAMLLNIFTDEIRLLLQTVQYTLNC